MAYCLTIFSVVNSKVAQPTSDLAKAKISGQEFVHKSPPLGAIVEAGSNLFAAVKTTARERLAASPLRKKSGDFFRLRSNSGVFSSSIFNCTAHNAAYCDAGNGTPQKGFWLLSQ